MFFHSLSNRGIATQIAGLVNDYNSLSAKRNGAAILQGRTDYVVETHGKLVIATVGLNRDSYTLTEMKHLVVRPEWQRKGVAEFIAKRALGLIDTPMVYATIREDNLPSLSLFKKLGFVTSGKYDTKDHRVVLMTRAAPEWQKKAEQVSKSELSFEQTMAEIQDFSPMFESWMDGD